MTLDMTWVDEAVERALRKADEYFMGIHEIHRTAETLVRRLREAGINHAVAGALALNAHGVSRMAEDLDLLLTRDGLAKFKALWLGRGYVELRSGGKAVRDTETRVKIDFLLTGDFPGDGKPKPVAFPDPKAVAVEGERYAIVALPRFVELKLASGMTARDRPRDLDDVIRLIRVRGLDRGFADQLDPYVRAKYLELWEAAQTPSEDY
jgi:hypothetical protein